MISAPMTSDAAARFECVKKWNGHVMRELFYNYRSLTPQDIEDVSQEVNIVLLTRESIIPEKVNATFIKRLVKGEVLDFFRDTAREPSATSAAVEFAEEHEPLLSHDYIVDSWGETLSSIAEFLTPERFRVVYLLAEGYTYPETAAALGITVNKVKSLQAQVARRSEALREHAQAINAII